MSAYWLIIFISGIIILSFIFNVISKRTRIPAVLLLILVGLILGEVATSMGYIENFNIKGTLEVLGIIGLIMIVLEAALDLKLTKEHWPIIWRSFSVALILLLMTSAGVAYVIDLFLETGYQRALLYATPLSIMSSAIIIPSVGDMDEKKKEFMIYESTFSDILGIVLFYILLDSMETTDYGGLVQESLIGVGITILLAIVVTYAMVWFFENVLHGVNYFLVFAMLTLIYVFSKMAGFSALIIIMIFGIMVNNKKIFFRGFMKKLINPETYGQILDNFKLFTAETAFIVRTFFFVLFGMSISVAALLNFKLYLVTALILFILYGVRWINLKLFLSRPVFPELFLSPRGLITILLFFSIPEAYMSDKFEEDLILLVIMATNIIMMIAMMRSGKQEEIEELHRKGDPELGLDTAPQEENHD